MSKASKLDWVGVWMKFDKWYDKHFACEWELQQSKIEQLIEKELKLFERKVQ